MIELRAQSFVVIDAAGNEKGRLSCDEVGAVRLVLGSGMELTAGADGTCDIALADAGSRDRLRLQLRQGGLPLIALVDANGLLRCGLTLLDDGTPALVVGTPDGEIQMKLLVDRKRPRLELVEQNRR